MLPANNIGLAVALLAMTLCGAAGAALFKQFHRSGRKRIYIFAGLGSYGTGALLNIYLLGVLPYTVVMPANAFAYVWSLLLANWLYGEPLGKAKWAGAGCIVAGLALLAVSG